MNATIRVYCDRHDDYVGSPYPPRCTACDILTAEYAELGGSTCAIHPAHLTPCEKCEPEAYA
jgi:hypothetical protein